MSIVTAFLSTGICCFLMSNFREFGVSLHHIWNEVIKSKLSSKNIGFKTFEKR